MVTFKFSKHDMVVFPGSVAGALDATWHEKSNKRGGPTGICESILLLQI